MERQFGWAVVGTIYLLSGLCAALTTGIFLPSAVAVGASGAILGLFGAEWADLFANWNTGLVLFGTGRSRRIVRLAVPSGIMILTSLLPFVNFYAHLSGMLCGTTIGVVLMIRRRFTKNGLPKRTQPVQFGCAIIGLVLTTVLVAAQLGVLYTSVRPESPMFSDLCIPLGGAWSCETSSMGSTCQEVWQGGESRVEIVQVGCMDGSVIKEGDPSWPENTKVESISDTEGLTRLCRAVCVPYCGGFNVSFPAANGN